jgi:hypothetical protein
MTEVQLVASNEIQSQREIYEIDRTKVLENVIEERICNKARAFLS